MLLDNQNQVPKKLLKFSFPPLVPFGAGGKNLIDQREIQSMGITPGKMVKNALWSPTSWIAALSSFSNSPYVTAHTFSISDILATTPSSPIPVQGFLHSFTSVKLIKTLASNKIVNPQIRTWDINYSICI